MSYQDQQALSVDGEFLNRLWAALATEAVAKPAADPVGIAVLRNPFIGVGMFIPFVATAPTFGTRYASSGQADITDGDILSAIQAFWSRVIVG